MKIDIDDYYPTKEQLEREFGVLESYEWTTIDGKRLKVWFHREYISESRPSMMRFSQAWTVERLEEV